MNVRSARGRRAALLAVALVAVTTAHPPAPAHAQTVKPWVPAGSDSITGWAAEARLRFTSNRGDSVMGSNYRAYELVGMVGRRLLRSLGPSHMLQAGVIEPVIDSLGMNTEIAIDPATPQFAVLMVHNPYRMTAETVGFLYWWKGDDLRMQGGEFKGGFTPRMRAWWTGNSNAPYKLAVIENGRGPASARFSLFQLGPTGTYWDLVQWEERAQVLTGADDGAWVDINHDGTPELVSYLRPRTDSLVVTCSDCPKLTTENTFIERSDGFVLYDTRLMPGPLLTFVTFIRLLLDGNRAAAAHLVAEPELVTEALSQGWGVKRAPRTWTVEYGEPNEIWPHWFEVRFNGPQGVKRYVVHFDIQTDGHWIIHHWVEPKPAQPHAEQRNN